MKKFWLLQFAANALLIFAFYEWLGVRDSRVSQLILSLVLGLAIAAGTVFLHSQTFHVKPARFAALLLIFILVWWVLGLLPLDRMGLWIASTLAFKLRKPVKPDLLYRIFSYLRMFVEFIIVPLILLQWRSPKLWLRYVLVVIGAFCIPTFLIHWTPKLTATWLQVTSFVVRFGVAYCLFVTGLVAFWVFSSAGKPVDSQPRTVTLP